MSAAAADRILEQLAALGISPGGACVDSRRVTPGDLFLAYPGARADGRAFIADAIARGASAVVWEKEGYPWRAEHQVPHLPAHNLRDTAGYLAHVIYGRPSEGLCMIGVTGTNGKTSVTQWIARSLDTLGRKCAVIGTLGAGFPDDLSETANTTPDAVMLHRLLARFVDGGARAAAMEVSSIGLDQGRVNGVQFDVAVFTNLTRDHLEYHGTMEAYGAAKKKLFEWPRLRAAVINVDDRFGRQLCQDLHGGAVKRIGYSLAAHAVAPRTADEPLFARDLALSGGGLSFTAVTPEGEAAIAVPMVGEFNAANLLAVLGALRAAGVPLHEAAAAVNGLTPPPGRMQTVGGAGMPLAVIDYAHTPDALEKALSALRPTAKARGGRLLCVFGCGGERDPGKRPLMGEAAARLADAVVLTSDNPRGEEPQAILDDIVRGAGAAVRTVVERAEAIRSTLLAADARDVVLIAGKGHEPYQEVGGVRLPFSDLEHARQALAVRAGGAAC